MDEPRIQNGWHSYEKLVLDKLDSIEERLTNHDDRLLDIAVAIATLKLKSGIWGALAGLLPALGVTILAWIAMK